MASGRFNPTTMLSFRDLEKIEKRNIFRNHDVFFFDIDGVIVRGGELIPGAADALNKLHESGKSVILFTNNCAVQRGYILQFLKSALPFLRKEDIISSSFLAAKYLEGWSKRNPGKKIYALGVEGLIEELEDANLDFIMTSDNTKIEKLTDLSGMKLNKEVGAVILGGDLRFTYYKLVELVNYVRDPQVDYVLTHVDKVMAGRGDIALIPGAGSIAASVEAATGRKPVNVGKPSDFACDYLRSLISEGKKAIFIGDMLSTDILLANKCGMTSILVLSGVSTLEDARKASFENDFLKVPKYYTNSILDFVNFII